MTLKTRLEIWSMRLRRAWDSTYFYWRPIVPVDGESVRIPFGRHIVIFGWCLINVRSGVRVPLVSMHPDTIVHTLRYPLGCRVIDALRSMRVEGAAS